MKNHAAIRERYLRDSVAVRLGGLAANLARIKSFSDHPDHQDVVLTLVEESKYFIEWTAPDAALHVQALLVDIQVQLALWHLRWNDIWADPIQRTSVAEQADNWSKKVLKMSGLLR
jgi:hypothetical protein